MNVRKTEMKARKERKEETRTEHCYHMSVCKSSMDIVSARVIQMTAQPERERVSKRVCVCVRQKQRPETETETERQTEKVRQRETE